MRKTGIAVLAVLTGLMLFGCGSRGNTSTFSPEQSSVFVTRDGKFTSAMVETYEEVYYSEEELKDFIKKEIDAYNTKAGKEAVSLDSCTMSNGTATAVFKYVDGTTVCDFAAAIMDPSTQVQQIEWSTITEELAKKKVEEGSWVEADDGNSRTRGTTQLKLLSFDGVMTIQTEGKIRYYSGDITLIDDFTVSANGGQVYIAFK